MKCDKIQQLILTDYTDGELNEIDSAFVDKHLETCRECRALAEKTNALSLSNALVEKPSDQLWQNIKNGIQDDEVREPLWEKLREALRYAPPLRSPVFALATVAMLMIASGFLLRSYFFSPNEVSVYVEEQFDYLDTLNNGNGNGFDDIGIPMEDFFL